MMETTVISIAALVVAVGALLGLGRMSASTRKENRMLQQRCESLAQQVDELAQELGGVCAAGVQRDRAAIEQDQVIRECLERLESMQVQDTGNYPYHGAIEMIRKGAGPQEVANEMGISLSEADLLVRLHRSS
jgi:hypothetical protein